jgi:hypothetical protein
MASGLKIVWPIPDPISELRAERPPFAQTIVDQRLVGAAGSSVPRMLMAMICDLGRRSPKRSRWAVLHPALASTTTGSPDPLTVHSRLAAPTPIV